MGKIHCQTCTCEATTRRAAGDIICPNCLQPQRTLGWLRYHLTRNLCEKFKSTARAREANTSLTAKQYIAKYGDPLKLRKYNQRIDPARW